MNLTRTARQRLKIDITSMVQLSHEEISSGVTRRFGSDVYHFVELDETRKVLEGFVHIPWASRVMTALLNFRPLTSYI